MLVNKLLETLKKETQFKGHHINITENKNTPPKNHLFSNRYDEMEDTIIYFQNMVISGILREGNSQYT